MKKFSDYVELNEEVSTGKLEILSKKLDKLHQPVAGRQLGDFSKEEVALSAFDTIVDSYIAFLQQVSSAEEMLLRCLNPDGTLNLMKVNAFEHKFKVMNGTVRTEVLRNIKALQDAVK